MKHLFVSSHLSICVRYLTAITREEFKLIIQIWGARQIISFLKTGPNLEPIIKSTWSLPRDREFAEDRYLDVTLTSKRQDWQIVRE